MNQVLLVEGKNDLHVFVNIFEKHGVIESFKIEGKDGDSIYKSIPIYLKTDVESIGIVVDADENVKNKWDKLKGIFSNADYKIPNSPDSLGLIVESENRPDIGIWIMPDNNKNGMLEDFVQQLVPKSDNLMKYVDETLAMIENGKVNKYKDIHKAKARIHTWLAWQETPGTPMGLAIKKTYLDTNLDLCKKFVDWINKLYNNHKIPLKAYK
ncbi:MAG: DUF3226 domain-containing protein [Bacteroidota bacterium]|nr:DUF3226 domain-containing protein [Bacteroidota bacterium]